MTRTKEDEKYTKQDVARIAKEFRTARDGASKVGQGLKCAGKPAEYVDYDMPPSTEQAAELCSGCPLTALCLEYALATKQAWGVWGGRVIVAGKLLDEEEKVA